MKDIITICRELGIAIEEGKEKELTSAVAKEYKTVAEYDKKVQKLEEERDDYKTQLKTANDTLEKLDGLDPEAIKQERAEYENKIRTLKEEHQKEKDARSYEEAVDKSLESMKFTSEYAKMAVKREIMAAGLKQVDGKLMGINDLIESIKTKDTGVFVNEEQKNLENNKAKFTDSLNNSQQEQKAANIKDIRKAMGLPAEKKEE